MAQSKRSTDGSPCESDPACGSEPAVAAAAPSHALDAATDRRGFPASAERAGFENDPDGGYRRPAPFAWQHGRQLLLLDEEPDGQWVMAELWFDADQCRYVEIRRSGYEWAREAVGAVLSRALAHGHIAAAEGADYLDAWYDSSRGERVAAG